MTCLGHMFLSCEMGCWLAPTNVSDVSLLFAFSAFRVVESTVSIKVLSSTAVARTVWFLGLVRSGHEDYSCDHGSNLGHFNHCESGAPYFWAHSTVLLFFSFNLNVVLIKAAVSSDISVSFVDLPFSLVA